MSYDRAPTTEPMEVDDVWACDFSDAELAEACAIAETNCSFNIDELSERIAAERRRRQEVAVNTPRYRSPSPCFEDWLRSEEEKALVHHADYAPPLYGDLADHRRKFLWRYEEYGHLTTGCSFPRCAAEHAYLKKAYRYMAEEYPFEVEYWSRVEEEQKYLDLILTVNK